MARRPELTNAFAGQWRIVEMDGWSNDVLDLGEKAHITFEGTSSGEIAFVAVKGFLDVRYGSRDAATYAEFSWQGFDDADETCGRGWATIGNDDRLIGHIFIHQGDDSAFIGGRE